MIKAVGFDLDDTLYDRNLMYKNTYHIMEQNVIDTGISFQYFNQVFQEESLIEFKKFDDGIKGDFEYRIDRVIQTYKRLGKDITDEQALIFHTLYLYHRNHIQLRDGMKNLIDSLISKGIEVFILTNGSKESQLKKIKQLGLINDVYRKNIFISEEIGESKPQKKVFDTVERVLGLTGKEILYIGDHYENDILGSVQHNWDAIYFNIHQIEIKEDIIQFYTDKDVYQHVKNMFKNMIQ